jgi:hypothetical protein
MTIELLVIDPGAYLAFCSCVAVNFTEPVFPVGLIKPDDESIVATCVLLEEYTIGESLILVGIVIGMKGVVFVYNTLFGTMKDDVFSGFGCNTKTMIEPAINHIDLPSYCITSTTLFVS